ncbi:hypothetical protein M434DRAFT_31555 [Hypoxylon sp. CO27-5]|nr:hypothetical protein M434DRAFT_31555 [Hypoxylon sp. CO27-5]
MFLINLLNFIIYPLFLAADICEQIETFVFGLLHMWIWTNFRMFPCQHQYEERYVGLHQLIAGRILPVILLVAIPELVRNERRTPGSAGLVGRMLRPLTNASLTAAYALMFFRVWLVVAVSNTSHSQIFQGGDFFLAWIATCVMMGLGFIPL